MPAYFRPKQGRKRFKNRAFRGARWKMAVADRGYKFPDPRVFPVSGHRINMGRRRFGFWAAVRRCLRNMWARRQLGLFLLLLWSLVILCNHVNTDSVSPNDKVTWHSEDREPGSSWEVVFNFLFPTTCIIRENQEVVACNKQPYLNKAECLRFKCCFSSTGSNMRCYAPLRDKPTQMLRVFGFAAVIMIVLGFLPMYCCSLCRGSRWFNPLRRNMSRVVKVVRKHKKKTKRESKAKKAPEEREDRKEHETRESFSESLSPETVSKPGISG